MLLNPTSERVQSANLPSRDGSRSLSELRTASHVEAAAWDSSVLSLNGTIFHAAAWAKSTIAEQPSARPTFHTMVEPDGSIAGVAIGFRRVSSRNITAPFSGSVWLDSLPAVRDGAAAVSRFVSLIENESRRAGDVMIRIGSFASPGSGAILGSLGYTLERRFEFELDLTKDEKSLWDRIDIKRRQRIRKAMKTGVDVRELPATEGVSHLRRLQAASFQRIVARGGPSLNKRELAGEDPVTALTSRGFGRIVGGFVDGECVSASFFSTFNGLAYYALSGHDAKALATQAPSLVLWEMALRFQRERFTKLNLGGCGVGAIDENSPEHGVYTYKKAFGGAQRECASGEKVLRPTVRRVVNMLRRVIR